MNGKSEAETPEAYIAELDEPRRTEVQSLYDLIRELAPDQEPHIQAGMIGFGRYKYRYESGRSGEWFRIGLASGKSGISVYATGTNEGGYIVEQHKNQFGKANVGKSCIRFKKVEDIDLDVLKRVLRMSLSHKGIGGQ